MATFKLYNRGPHSVAYRGHVEVGHDAEMSHLDSRFPIKRHHGDVICPHLHHFHSQLSGDLYTPLCTDSVNLDAPAADLTVSGGTTGIRTSEITGPVRIGTMTVSGAGSVGIDLDDTETK